MLNQLWFGLSLGLAAIAIFEPVSHAQIVITEVMFNPAGDEDLWEWVEVKNTSAAPVNMNGWVFGDRASRFGSANIQAGLGNTIVPANGTAVIHPSSALSPNAAQRFANAWGSGITLIPTSTFPALNGSGGDRIGLWSSHADYFVNALAEPDWGQAVFEIDYATTNGFPGVSGTGGPSIAWTGSGSASVGNNWERSELGTAGAHMSNATFLSPTQINSPLDRGNPGLIPPGPVPIGLKITEVMYNPASPSVSQEFSESHFEWIEVLNNTGGPLNFAANQFVFDDIAGNDLAAANISSGSLANGQVGILFNSEEITIAEMQAAWGGGLNYIPVSDWPSLANDGDTIAIWPSLAAYQSEPFDAPNRSHNNASTFLTYDNSAAASWPTDDNRSSIYWNDFAANQALGSSWRRAGVEGGSLGSFPAGPIVRAVADNLGQDVGSPGFVPSTGVVLAGDYNSDGFVNAADYTVWRNNLHAAITLPNEEPTTTPGTVTWEDYLVWKNNYGAPSGSGTSDALGSQVPEPSSIMLLAAALVCALRLTFGRTRRFHPRTRSLSTSRPYAASSC